MTMLNRNKYLLLILVVSITTSIVVYYIYYYIKLGFSCKCILPCFFFKGSDNMLISIFAICDICYNFNVYQNTIRQMDHCLF